MEIGASNLTANDRPRRCQPLQLGFYVLETPTAAASEAASLTVFELCILDRGERKKRDKRDFYSFRSSVCITLGVLQAIQKSGEQLAVWMRPDLHVRYFMPFPLALLHHQGI